MKAKHLYHPLEIVISGYSGSGKTTLVEKLIALLGAKFKVAYIKHDAHAFEMDKEGKDTFKAWQSGAHLVSIHDKDKTALIERRPQDPKHVEIERALWVEDNDFAIIEGFKHTQAEKILVVGTDENRRQTLNDLKDNKITNVLALVTAKADEQMKEMASLLNVPLIDRNNVAAISHFILEHLRQKIVSRPIKGLVLAGGQSSRMGEDKGAIKYHGKFQTQHLYDCLKKHCQEVFVSCREEQKNLPHIAHLPQIHDKLINMGPMGGIVSAMLFDPEAYWVVVACDLPFMDEYTLEHLIKNWNPYKQATCYLSQEGLPEPLCGIYSPSFRFRIFSFLGQNLLCSRKIMLNSNISGLELPFIQALYNANTPEERKEVEKQLLGEVQ